ncbi:TPA: glycosyltransferase [Escherichia coli]|nr:glycosyltransferase [Escherichia coli]
MVSVLHRELRQHLPPHIQGWTESAGNIPLIVQVGMLRPEKGHEFMLRVLHQLKMEGKVFRWLVVGAGREEYEERLRLQIESLGMSGDVFMAGAVFPALPIYRVASVLSCLLKNEAFGMVLAEASASGVPVIASETGGIPDAIQKNVTGTLLPVGDMTAWTSALRDFLSRPERFRMMVASAREDIEYRFNINRTVQTIVSLAHQTGGNATGN